MVGQEGHAYRYYVSTSLVTGDSNADQRAGGYPPATSKHGDRAGFANFSPTEANCSTRSTAQASADSGQGQLIERGRQIAEELETNARQDQSNRHGIGHAASKSDPTASRSTSPEADLQDCLLATRSTADAAPKADRSVR